MKSLTIAFLFAFCAMVARADNAPSYTPDEKAFLSLFQFLYETGDKEGLLSLVDWQGTPKEIQSTIKFVLLSGSGTDKITSIALVPYSKYPNFLNPPGYNLAPTFTPSYWLMVKHAGNAGDESKPNSSHGSFRFAAGWHNGKIMLPGLIDSKNTPTPAK